jgi:hypothetical protein
LQPFIRPPTLRLEGSL